VHHRAYLWQTEEWLQLFTPTNYRDRGSGRILLTGASEAREGFLPGPFEEALRGVEAYQNSMSAGVIEDVPLLLEYMEGAYGAGAVPDRVVIGVAFRMAMNYLPNPGETPLRDAIDRYSPVYSIDKTSYPRLLVPKGPAASLASRFRLLGHQGARYRRGLTGALGLVWARLEDRAADAGWRRKLGLVPSRFYDRPARAKARYWKTPTPYPRLANVRPLEQAERLRQSFDELRRIADHRGTEFYVVNLPEGPWMEGFYPDGVYAEYDSLLRRSVGDFPFLDLRWFLEQEEFFDWVHPTPAGARRLSDRVARFVAGTERADVG